MSDLRSKLPDLKEISSIAGKLFKDLKTSINEIVSDYKKKREDTEEAGSSEKTGEKPAAKAKKQAKKAESDDQE